MKSISTHASWMEVIKVNSIRQIAYIALSISWTLHAEGRIPPSQLDIGIDKYVNDNQQGLSLEESNAILQSQLPTQSVLEVAQLVQNKQSAWLETPHDRMPFENARYFYDKYIDCTEENQNTVLREIDFLANFIHHFVILQQCILSNKEEHTSQTIPFRFFESQYASFPRFEPKRKIALWTCAYLKMNSQLHLFK